MDFQALATKFALKNLGVLRHLDVFRKLATVKLQDVTEVEVREVAGSLGLPLPDDKLAFSFLLGTLRSGGDVSIGAMFDDSSLIADFFNKFKEGMEAKTASMRSERLAAADDEEIITLPNFSVLSKADLGL